MIPLVAAGIIGGAGSVLSGLFASGAAGKAKRAAEREKARLQKKLNHLEANRQEIINPYDAVGEQKRLQQADASGRAFVYGEQEKREQQQLDRTASLIGMAETVRAQSQADQTSAGLSMFGGVTDALGGIAAAGGFNKPPSNQ